ncbi:MAG: hypothetical protein RIR86_2455, partial [Acidobacteriota bacterium]
SLPRELLPRRDEDSPPGCLRIPRLAQALLLLFHGSAV